MGLMKYLGGIGLYLLGGFLIFIGIVSSIVAIEMCAILVVVGIIILLSGVFYTRTSTYDVPRHIKIVNKKKKRDDDIRCTNCGRVIPIDAKICPYCSKKLIEDVKEINDSNSPIEILKNRFAKGELTEEEYERMKKKLEG